MNYRLYSHLYLHLKDIYIKKDPSHLLEKPDNWFALAKMWEKHLKKKEILRNGPGYLHKISLWDSFQFSFMQIKNLVSP